MEYNRQFIKDVESNLCKKYGIEPDFLEKNETIKEFENGFLCDRINSCEFYEFIKLAIKTEALCRTLTILGNLKEEK